MRDESALRALFPYGQAGRKSRAIDTRAEGQQLLDELLQRVSALEDNVAFLEVWCEEQQDALDRIGEPVFFFEEPLPEVPHGPVHLRVVDLRDGMIDEDDDDEDEVPLDETDHERRVRLLRARIRRVRNGLPIGSAAVVVQRDASRS